MGLSLGDVLGSVFTGGLSTQVDTAGSVLGVQNPRTTAVVTGISTLFGPEAGQYAAQLGAALVDDSGNTYPDSGGGGDSGGGVLIPTAGVMPAIATALASAIVKLARVFGGVTAGAARNPLAYARRIWESLSSWAAKNPGVSMISLLVSLGLTVEEAAHFLAWGATKKRKRRGRGISARDVRTTRRTLRKVASIERLLGHVRHYARRSSSSPRSTIIRQG